jgi:hypothetical protein
MILEALAAAVVATAAPAAQPVAQSPPAQSSASQGDASTPSVSPLLVRPLPSGPADATVDVPVDDSPHAGAWASVWPEDAYKARIPGHVVLICDVDRYGIAEACVVGSETPPGKGFGAAALELRPTLKLQPRIGPDGPTDAQMRIAVEFKPPDPHFDFGTNRGGGPVGERAGGGGMNYEFSDLTMAGNPLQRRSISMLNNPVWTSTVGYGDLVRAYPPKAGGMEGYAVAHCQVSPKGSLAGCMVIREDPDKHGFGKAALALASKFRVDPAWARAPGHAQLWVDIPFRFPAPGSAENRRVSSPYWLAGFDPDQALKLYPPEAAEKGVASGHGVAKCIIAADGSLSDCAPAEADPEGMGFSEAAAKLASTLRMNPWTPDGSPVDGAVVRVGVRLDLKRQ